MTIHTIIWKSEDEQNTIDMSGEYDHGERQGAVFEAACEIVYQCGADDEVKTALEGTIDGTELCEILSGYDLMDANTAEVIRAARPEEVAASTMAGRLNGGRCLISVDEDTKSRTCYCA